MKKISISGKEELKELIGNIQKNNQIRFFVFGTFLILSLLLKWQAILVPWLVIEIIGLLLFVNILCELLVRKIWSKQTVSQASLGYFILQLIEVAALLIAISAYEAVLFGGIAVLMVWVIFCYLGFTRRLYPRLLTLLSLIGYITIGLIEYFGISDFVDYHNLGINPYQNHSLFVTTLSFMVGFFIYLAFYSDIFSRRLRNSIKILKTREKELSEARTDLEIQVKVRTQELKKLAKNFDEQVKEKTKELQKKIEELERFQKLAVGRELKMIELKEKIKKLKESLKSKKNKYGYRKQN